MPKFCNWHISLTKNAQPEKKPAVLLIDGKKVQIVLFTLLTQLAPDSEVTGLGIK